MTDAFFFEGGSGLIDVGSILLNNLCVKQLLPWWFRDLFVEKRNFDALNGTIRLYLARKTKSFMFRTFE
jgi:hypothetical protein